MCDPKFMIEKNFRYLAATKLMNKDDFFLNVLSFPKFWIDLILESRILQYQMLRSNFVLSILEMKFPLINHQSLVKNKVRIAFLYRLHEIRIYENPHLI